jgi:hypothetical protein
MTACRPFFCLTVCCAVACATGVPVSDDELAELQAQSSSGGRSASSSAIAGNGGSTPPLSGPGGNGASTPPLSGLGGNGGSTPPLSGLGGSAGTAAQPVGGSGGATVPINPGAGCGSPAPVAAGGCTAPGAGISVIYSDRSDAPGFNQLTMTLSVDNAGADFDLTDLVLRYWFAADQGQTDFVAEIDYAQIGKENVCVSFGNQLGQSFADIGFSANQALGTGVQDIQLRLHTPSYAQQDQTNDFSFVAGADALANENITVYRAGTRVAGCEPD